MINGASIRGIWESVGPEECLERLGALLLSRRVNANDFSLREIAEAFCGPEWVRRLSPRNTSRYAHLSLREAGEGVDVTAFSNITGQIVYSEIHQGWDQAGLIGDQLFTTRPTAFDGEKIPGVGLISKEGADIRPGMPYPEAGLSEHYWETPSTTKQGEIVSVTKEAVYFDRTALVTERARGVGKRLRYRKEKKQLAVYAGITVTLDGGANFNGNNHKWNGTSYNTYATTTNAIGINSKASTPLTDWEDINVAEQLFNELTDPDTGNPIEVMPNTLVVMPARLYVAKRIQTATSVRSTTPGYATSGSPVVTESDNPVTISKVLTSKLLRKLIVDSGVSAANADDWWFYGDPKQAFLYLENWPLTVVQAPPNSTAEFERDIVDRWKASERGTPYSKDPRYNVKMYNA